MSVFTEKILFRKACTFVDAILNIGCVADRQIADSANISAAKLEHSVRLNYSQAEGVDVANDGRVIHVVNGTVGTLKSIRCGLLVACTGDSTVTVVIAVNGVSVLVTPVTLDNAVAADEIVDAAIQDEDLSANDIIEVSITATPGTGTLGEGVFVAVELYEDAL